MSGGKQRDITQKSESVRKAKAFRTVSNDDEPETPGHSKAMLQNRIRELPRSPRYKGFSQLNTGDFKQQSSGKMSDKRTGLSKNEADRHQDGGQLGYGEAEDEFEMSDFRSPEQASKSQNNFRPLKKLSKSKLLIQKVGKNSYSLVNQADEDQDNEQKLQAENMVDDLRSRPREGQHRQNNANDANEEYQMIQSTGASHAIAAASLNVVASEQHQLVNIQKQPSNKDTNARHLTDNTLAQ